jgi:NAD(P)-dependent dehydrogenase (short-subunit alcohol dehydrogenase family)
VFLYGEYMDHITNDVHHSEAPEPDLAVVLGASGGLGRALLEQLLEDGRRVRAVGRTRPEWLKTDDRLEWLEADTPADHQS